MGNSIPISDAREYVEMLLKQSHTYIVQLDVNNSYQFSNKSDAQFISLFTHVFPIQI